MDTLVQESVKSENGRIQTTILRVILGQIVVGPFILYWTGHISKDNLNRSGIILNFLAGFLVAPDLIGVKRLKRVEWVAENVLKHIYTKSTMPPLFGNRYQRITKLGCMVILSYVPEFTFIWLFPLYWIQIIAGFSIVQLVICCISFFGDPLLEINWDAIALPFVPLIVFCVFVAVVFWIPAFIFIELLALFISTLEGEERLKSILVFWGVIFFIMGNVMQFVATF